MLKLGLLLAYGYNRARCPVRRFVRLGGEFLTYFRKSKYLVTRLFVIAPAA